MARILVTGGAGYVGSALVPALLDAGHEVCVIDICWYGKEVLKPHPSLRLIQADIRDLDAVRAGVAGCETVIHLACISNDPSFELDPGLGRSINLDAFAPLVDAAVEAGVSRFIYASSSSVYGIKEDPEVHEDLPLDPLTDYSRYKADCETILLARRSPSFVPIIIRPATVCGYAPRMRLDLTVNILTHHAFRKGKITVFGGVQKRPNIHIADMVRAYLAALDWPAELVSGEAFNVGYENFRVSEIAEQVREVVGRQVEITTTPSDDLRSYHISSKKVRDVVGFSANYTIADAAESVRAALADGRIAEPDHRRHYNIRTMQHLGLG